MNLTKRVLCLALACVMLCMLCACGNKAEVLAARQEELCANLWLTITPDSEEQALALLENIDMYPEEIALVDLTSLEYARIMEYKMDGTYRQYISVEHTKDLVREFYEGVFHTLYDNRTALGSLYEEDLASMDKEQFLTFYASLYAYEDFYVLLGEFVDSAYDYQWEDLESGTYTMKSVNIISIKRTSTDPEADPTGTIPFKLENGTLTLEYGDGDVTYTKYN